MLIIQSKMVEFNQKWLNSIKNVELNKKSSNFQPFFIFDQIQYIFDQIRI